MTQKENATGSAFTYDDAVMSQLLVYKMQLCNNEGNMLLNSSDVIHKGKCMIKHHCILFITDYVVL